MPKPALDQVVRRCSTVDPTSNDDGIGCLHLRDPHSVRHLRLLCSGPWGLSRDFHPALDGLQVSSRIVILENDVNDISYTR